MKDENKLLHGVINNHILKSKPVMEQNDIMLASISNTFTCTSGALCCNCVCMQIFSIACFDYTCLV